MRDSTFFIFESRLVCTRASTVVTVRGAATDIASWPACGPAESEQAGSLDRVVAVDELDTEVLRFRIDHERVTRREAIERVAA